jgi:hypothetical protein
MSLTFIRATRSATILREPDDHYRAISGLTTSSRQMMKRDKN